MSDKDKINKFDSIKESKGSNSEGGYSVPLPSVLLGYILLSKI